MVSADDMGQCLCDGEWLTAGAFEIEIELRVGIMRFELLDELECERCFTDTAQTLQTGDSNAALVDRSEQLFELVFAASEVSGWWRHLMQCRCHRIGRRRNLYDVVIASDDRTA